VRPDSLKLVEVGRVVLLAIGVVPEVHRHWRERPERQTLTIDSNQFIKLRKNF
jgi:hypothetical protein